MASKDGEAVCSFAMWCWTSTLCMIFRPFKSMSYPFLF
ncbi:hypothetical protein IHE45_05G172700 [Dioscorea alata]|uniref:Uncharacterized protein n=1 Tax=Dioscorea alata TaxID=55571 RepID=A0ACB7W6Q3_DIOAL|nr:hypothetical protein IHE45_05G172700 [Dioscorea alata]